MTLTRVALLFLIAACPAQAWVSPEAADFAPAVRGEAPLLACTSADLGRLRVAFATGERVVVARVDAARERRTESLSFPPRGGQHNQWYQCDACQRALTTVSDTEHRCPGCRKTYTGPPYDDVVFSRQHAQNLARALDAAWAYALTGEVDFAADARAILLGYADRYERYPYHSNDRDPTRKRDSGGHLKEQTLSEATMFVGQIAPAIDLVWPALDDAQRAHLREHLVRPLVRNVAKCRRGKSNWQSWHNAALFAGGILLDDAELMQRAVLDPQHGFLFQMGACVSAEGMWYENSFGYHLYTLDALVHLARLAERAGVGLMRHPTLTAMATLPGRYVLADGTLPRLGDDVSSSPARAARALEAVHAATRDPRVRAVLPGVPGWESVQYGRTPETVASPPVRRSELFPHAGHALLRAREASALLTFAPFGGFHDHFDRLGFAWHARGMERGVDPGRAASQAYRLPIHNGWYRATLAHNTVVVDGKSQAGAGAELLAFASGEGCEAVVARSTAAYPGVEHRRCLVLSDDVLVVLDVLGSEAEHTFDWLYHDAGEAVRCAVATQTGPGALGVAGEEFVRWLGAGETAGACEVHFSGRGLATRLLVAAGGATTVRIATGPFHSVSERAPFALLRRRGKRVTFAVALCAEAPGGASGVTAVRVVDAEDGVTLLVERGSRVEKIVWDGGRAVRREL